MGATRAVRLDPARRGSAVQKLEDGLRHYLIGQDDAIDAITDSYQMYCAGLTDGNRPVSNMLFCGPTGTGKTFTAEMVAREIAGTKEALVKIDCAEFQHSHEIAKLVGSPPGYLRHRETHPRLTQETLNMYHKDNMKMSFVLFDEIE